MVSRPVAVCGRQGSIDGQPLTIRKGYNSIVRSPQRFIGYWADATQHVRPGTKQTLTLMLPGSGHGFAVESGFINQGNDAGSGNMTVAAAEARCSSQDDCVGFTFEKTAPEAKTACTAIAGIQKVLFKSAMSGSPAPTWCGPPQRGLSSDKISLITSDCGATRSLSTKWP